MLPDGYHGKLLFLIFFFKSSFVFLRLSPDLPGSVDPGQRLVNAIRTDSALIGGNTFTLLRIIKCSLLIYLCQTNRKMTELTLTFLTADLQFSPEDRRSVKVPHCQLFVVGVASQTDESGLSKCPRPCCSGRGSLKGNQTLKRFLAVDLY